MRRRSRRKRPVTRLGAFLIEVGTMLAIVALAQPTWTRSLIEQVGPASAAEPAPVVEHVPLVERGQALASPARSSEQHSGIPAGIPVAQASEVPRAMPPMGDTSQRLAMADWSSSSRPTHEYSAAPQFSQHAVDPYATSRHYLSSPRVNLRSVIRPVYPPPASSQPMPAWSHSY